MDRIDFQAGYQIRVLGLQGVNRWEFGNFCTESHKHLLLLKNKIKTPPRDNLLTDYTVLEINRLKAVDDSFLRNKLLKLWEANDLMVTRKILQERLRGRVHPSKFGKVCLIQNQSLN